MHAETRTFAGKAGLPSRWLGALVLGALVLGALVLGALPARPVAAQAPQDVTFRHLGVDGGLSAGKVNALLQGSRGFIWVGTIDGLNRFDGYAVTVFRHAADDSTSLSDDVVMSLLEDRDGYLWVGTSEGGLDRFDPASATFTAFRHDPDDPASLPSDEVRALAQTPDGALWAGTAAGLARLDPAAGRFTRFRHDPAQPRSLSHDGVLTLFVDAEGVLWVGTQDGLNRFDPASGTFDVFRNGDGVAGNVVNALAARREGGLWVGTLGGGLRVFDPASGTFRPVELTAERLSAGIILGLHEDRAGVLWVGTAGDGLHVLRPDGTRQAFRADRTVPESLSDNYVRAIMEDRQGVLWAGTYNGLDWFDRARRAFATYRHDPARPESLGSNTVLALLQTRDGALWVGTDEGLDRTDTTRAVFTHLDVPAAAPVSALHQTRDGTLWVGTQGGLYHFEDGRLERPGGAGQSAGLASAAISVLYEDRAGILWIGTRERGLGRLDRQRGTFAWLAADPQRAASLSDDHVTALAEAEDGTLWVGTGGGLDRLDAPGGGGRFAHVRHDPADTTSLSDDDVRSLLVADGGTLWVGTEGGGLNRFDPDRPEAGFVRYTVANSDLPGNAVHAVVEVGGYLWLSTNQGLARFDPVSEVFRPFGAEGPRDLNGTTALTAEGDLLFGSADGFIAVRPEDLTATNPYPPQVALTNVQILNEPVVPGAQAALRVAAPVAEAVYLGPEDEVVTFAFAALHFADPARNRYAVRLDGFDREWRQMGTTRQVTYTNLDPGRYTLLVKAWSADGVETPEPFTLRVLVAPPWWRTGWAYLLYALGFIGLLVGADRWQRRRFLRQERERTERREAELRAEMAEAEARVLKVENERKAIELEKASELQDAYAALAESHQHLQATQNQLIQAEKLASLGQLTAGIAHEIKNPLNFVNNFADLSVDLADELNAELSSDADRPIAEVLPVVKDLLDDLRENARRIHEHGQRADRIVHAMLQHSRGGAGEPVRVAINAFVEEYANLAYHGMRARDADFHVTLERDLDPEAGEVELIPQEMGRVMINLLSNAFDAVLGWARNDATAAAAGYDPTVTLRTRRRGDHVEIHVADNGPGIPPALHRRIFEPFFTTKATGSGTGLGLSLSYEIVTQGHGGDLRLEPAEGEGAAFVISLPDRQVREAGEG